MDTCKCPRQAAAATQRPRRPARCPQSRRQHGLPALHDHRISRPTVDREACVPACHARIYVAMRRLVLIDCRNRIGHPGHCKSPLVRGGAALSPCGERAIRSRWCGWHLVSRFQKPIIQVMSAGSMCRFGRCRMSTCCARRGAQSPGRHVHCSSLPPTARDDHVVVCSYCCRVINQVFAGRGIKLALTWKAQSQ